MLNRIFLQWNFSRNTQEFLPSYYYWYIKILKISCTANSPLYLFKWNFFLMWDRFLLRGRNFSENWRRETFRSASVDQSTTCFAGWLEKWGLWQKFVQFSFLYSVWKTENILREGKRTKNKRKDCRKMKRRDPARTRTWNPLIRSQMPYPLGHRAVTQLLHEKFYNLS